MGKAGVITKSVSPWTHPIVVVQKWTAPGQPQRRHLYVSYRTLNKCILTFVPLPKIDEIYARLKGSQICSTFDPKSGYYYMVGSEDARAIFLTILDKFKFT